MRKLFSDRARLVVYFEATDVNRMTLRAREEGKTLVEWARERLLGELEADTDVSGDKPVRVAERRVNSTPMAMAGVSEPDRPKRPTCKHGVEKNWRCWQCGGLAVIG